MKIHFLYLLWKKCCQLVCMKMWAKCFIFDLFFSIRADVTSERINQSLGPFQEHFNDHFLLNDIIEHLEKLNFKLCWKFKLDCFSRLGLSQPAHCSFAVNCPHSSRVAGGSHLSRDAQTFLSSSHALHLFFGEHTKVFPSQLRAIISPAKTRRTRTRLPFSTERPDLGLGGANSHPSLFTLGCELA